MNLARALLDLLVPPTCPGCGARRADGAFCAGCTSELTPARPGCPVCGAPQRVVGRCGPCRGGRPFRRARAHALHEGPLQGWVARLKYRGDRRLAHGLGRLVAQAAAEHFEPDTHDVLVPVPLAPSRLLHRGYNQAVLLADVVASCRGLDVVCALERAEGRRAQVGLRGEERRDNLAGVFAIAADAHVEGLSVLLIDDVLTTGATAEACAEVLLGVGAAAVDVLTVARAPIG